MLFCRSSNRDPGASASDCLSMKDHTGFLFLFFIILLRFACLSLQLEQYSSLKVDEISFDPFLFYHVIALLQEKKLLDLPKLLDICAIYGHENGELTKLLVGCSSAYIICWLLRVHIYMSIFIRKSGLLSRQLFKPD